MRLEGTRSARASWCMFRPRGLMNSSPRISPGWIGGASRRLFAGRIFLSVVVDDFDVFRITIAPFKAQSPLAIDSDAVLTRAVPRQLLQLVAGQDRKIAKACGGIQHFQFSGRDLLDTLELRASPGIEELLCFAVAKTLYHLRSSYDATSLTHFVTEHENSFDDA